MLAASTSPSGAQIKEPANEVMGSDIVSFDDLEAPGPVIQGGVDRHATETESGSTKTDEPQAKKEEGKEETVAQEKEASGKEEDSTKEETKEVVEKDSESVKLIKVSTGEETADLRADSTLSVKVDGTSEEVSLQDLRDNYSGKVAWDRKNTALTKDKQSFKRDQDTLQSYVSQLHQKITVEKDIMGTFALLADAMGANPVEILTEVNTAMAAQAAKWAEMDEGQRVLALKDKELDLLKKSQEVQTTRQSASDSLRKKQDQRREALEKSGLGEEAFESAFNQAKTAIEAGQGAGLTVDELRDNPEMVIEIHDRLEKHKAMSAMLKEVNPEAGEDAVSLLTQQWEQNPDFTVDDLKEIAVDAFGSQQAKNLSKKVRKSQPRGVQNESKASPQNDEVLFSFDQL